MEEQPKRKAFILFDGDLPRPLESQNDADRCVQENLSSSSRNNYRTDFTSINTNSFRRRSASKNESNQRQTASYDEEGSITAESVQMSSLSMYKQSQPNVGTTPLNQSPPFITTRNGLSWILAASLAGLCIGISMYYLNVPPSATKWIKLPGTLYTRATQCIVMPLVFVNLIVSVSDMVLLGRAKAVAWRLLAFTIFFTLIGVLEGIGLAHLVRYALGLHQLTHMSNKEALFSIQCSNGKYLEASVNGMVTCTASSVNSRSTFGVDDINGALERDADSFVAIGSTTTSLIELLSKFVPSNIIGALVDNSLLSIVTFAVACGITVARSFHGPVQFNPLLEFLRELNGSLITMNNLIVRMAPLAVFTLLTDTFGSGLKEHIRISPAIIPALALPGIFALGVVVHIFIILPIFLLVLTNGKPFSYIRYLFPAFIYSFGSASSGASLPVCIQCIKSSRQVAEPIVDFVMACATALHKNGTAIYLPLMIYFMVDLSGLSSDLKIGRVLILILACILGSIGASPIPGGNLVMLLSIWKICIPDHDLPDIYLFLTVIDVLMDRIATVANIYGGAILCRIISEQVEESITDEILRGYDATHYANI